MQGSITIIPMKFNITNSGSGAYTIDGTNNATIVLTRGNTYNLIIDAIGHPFWIQTVSGGYSSGNVYNSGITNNGTQSGTIVFTVASDAPNTLYYACQFHSSMQGTITIIS
jgi:plastocyanin